MPVIGYISPDTGLTREEKKVALSQLECDVLPWMETYGDDFPELRDLVHEITVQIDREREDL